MKCSGYMVCAKLKRCSSPCMCLLMSAHATVIFSTQSQTHEAWTSPNYHAWNTRSFSHVGANNVLKKQPCHLCHMVKCCSEPKKTNPLAQWLSPMRCFFFVRPSCSSAHKIKIYTKLANRTVLYTRVVRGKTTRTGNLYKLYQDSPG